MYRYIEVFTILGFEIHSEQIVHLALLVKAKAKALDSMFYRRWACALCAYEKEIAEEAHYQYTYEHLSRTI